MKYRRVILFSFIIGIYILVFSDGCSKKEIVSPSRTIIIGIDGVGWNVLNPLLERECLPTFQHLKKTGSYGVLKTIKPTKSSIIWTSIATGKSMIKHGIVDWTFVSKNNIKLPYSRSERRVKTFWNIFGEFGYKVGVINWFITYPPEKVSGYMVSEAFKQIYSPNFKDENVVYPRILQKKLIPFKKTTKDYKKILKQTCLPDFMHKAKNSRKGSLIRVYNIFVVQEKIIEDISFFLFFNWPTDIYATYFRLVDIVSHFATGLIDPNLLNKAKKEKEEKGVVTTETINQIDKALALILEPVLSYYDRILNRFLSSMNENDNIIIISDHSFVFENGGYGHTNMKNTPHGIILMKGPLVKKNFFIKDAHIYDILPTLLYLYDLPVAKDMDGKVLIEALDKMLTSKRKIRWIESYESDIQVESIKRRRNEKLDQKILEELRSLGYIK